MNKQLTLLTLFLGILMSFVRAETAKIDPIIRHFEQAVAHHMKGQHRNASADLFRAVDITHKRLIYRTLSPTRSVIKAFNKLEVLAERVYDNRITNTRTLERLLEKMVSPLVVIKPTSPKEAFPILISEKKR